MKILHVIPSLEIGGAEKIVANLCSGLATKNYDVSLLLFKDLSNKCFNVSDKVKIKLVHSKIPFKYNIYSLLKVFSYLKKEKFDVVHTHLTVNNTFVRLLAILAGIPVIIGHEHGGFLKRNGIARILLCKIEKYISFNLFISEHDREYFTKYDKNVVKNKNLVINNPLLINVKPLNFKNNKVNVIGMVGRIIETKGHFFALQAIVPFIREYRCKVIIVGDGDKNLRQELISFAKTNNIDLVITGYTKNVEEYYSKFDVLLQPSFSEGFGLAIIEAMAFGVPVIASNVGGIPNIIEHQKNGLLFETGYKTELLSRLYQINDDLKLKQNLSENGYEHVINKYSFTKYIHSIEKLYINAFNKKNNNVE